MSNKRKAKKKRAVKRNRQKRNDPEELKRAPHSFVIHRGDVGRCIQQLTRDFRKIMQPFTAASLKTRKRNSIKDFVSIAGVLHVTHICVFTQTKVGIYLKIARIPHGPTLTFKVHNYALACDVISMLRNQLVFDKQFRHAPLIILNSFSGEGLHMKVMASMFQNMFPTINLNKVNLNNIRRCVLLNYNSVSRLIDFRHYAIKVVPVGLSKGVKKIIQSKVPNLGRFEDISEFVTKSGQLSESEAEDDPSSHVTLPQKLSSRGNMNSAQSGVRMHEIGPRLTLQLMKLEEGLQSGETLFHEIVHKTEEEKVLIKKRRENKSHLKENRKKVQEDNKKKKEDIKEKLKQKSLEGMQRKAKEVKMKEDRFDVNVQSDEDDDDVEWYRKEVGEEPDKDLLTAVTPGDKRERKMFGGMLRKKQKLESTAKSNQSGEKKTQPGFSKNEKKRNKPTGNQKSHKKVLGGKLSKRF